MVAPCVAAEQALRKDEEKIKRTKIKESDRPCRCGDAISALLKDSVKSTKIFWKKISLSLCKPPILNCVIDISHVS